MSKPTIKRAKMTTVEFVGRLFRYQYGEGHPYSYENGLMLTELFDPNHYKIKSVSIRPVEGGPVDWIDNLMEELKIFRAALVEEQETRK